MCSPLILLRILYNSRSKTRNRPRNPDLYKCKMCNRYHSLQTCPKFRAMSPKERNRMVLRQNYCVNCLARSHRFRDCRSRYTCKICSKHHHTMLHPNDTNGTHKQQSNDNIRNNYNDNSGTNDGNSNNDTRSIPDQHILSEAIRSLASVLCATQQPAPSRARRHV